MSTAMNDADTVLYEVRDGIATVKINRPEIRNALSPAATNAASQSLRNSWSS